VNPDIKSSPVTHTVTELKPNMNFKLKIILIMPNNLKLVILK